MPFKSPPPKKGQLRRITLKFKNDMTVISGLRNRATDEAASHGLMEETWLTGIDPAKAEGSGVANAGVSIDQIAANHIGQESPLPSLQMSLEPVEFAGSCDSGYSCVYTNTLSWRGPTSPLPMENNPRAVFERLFGDSGSSDPAIIQRRLRQKRSVLDAVLEKATGVSRAVGATDRTRFDDYLQSIRDVFAKTYPHAQKLQECEFVDTSIIDELQRSGFIARLYGDSQ